MRTVLACSLATSLLGAAPLGVAAQPPPGTGGSPPVAPVPSGTPDVVVVPDSYGSSPGSSGVPSGGASPYGQGPYGPAPYGATPYGGTPYGTTPYGGTPYGQSPYGAAPYGSTPYTAAPYAGSVYGTYNVDPRLYAEYQALPRRGPYITLIVFGTFGILIGLPSLVQELRWGDPPDGGTVAFGAIATGLGAVAIGISAYKLHVRNAGIRRLREQGLQVGFGGAPSPNGFTLGARLAF